MPIFLVDYSKVLPDGKIMPIEQLYGLKDSSDRYPSPIAVFLKLKIDHSVKMTGRMVVASGGARRNQRTHCTESHRVVI